MPVYPPLPVGSRSYSAHRYRPPCRLGKTDRELASAFASAPLLRGRVGSRACLAARRGRGVICHAPAASHRDQADTPPSNSIVVHRGPTQGRPTITAMVETASVTATIRHGPKTTPHPCRDRSINLPRVEEPIRKPTLLPRGRLERLAVCRTTGPGVRRHDRAWTPRRFRPDLAWCPPRSAHFREAVFPPQSDACITSVFKEPFELTEAGPAASLMVLSRAPTESASDYLRGGQPVDILRTTSPPPPTNPAVHPTCIPTSAAASPPLCSVTVTFLAVFFLVFRQKPAQGYTHERLAGTGPPMPNRKK
jgi:hypothetical protein